MFGKRLIPCTIMGLAVGFALFTIATLAYAIVPAIGANYPTVGFAIGLSACTGVGLYADMAESETSKISATAPSPTPPTKEEIAAMIAATVAGQKKAAAA